MPSVDDLLRRLLEDDFLKAGGDFVPLALIVLGKRMGVSGKPLVQQADQQHPGVAAPAAHLRELLQEEHILSVGVQGGEFEKLAKLIQDNDETSGSPLGDQFVRRSLDDFQRIIVANRWVLPAQYRMQQRGNL